MAALGVRRVIFALLCTFPVIFAQDYVIPDVTIQALKPKGVRISIPDSPGMSLFVFQGHINRNIKRPEYGTLMAELDEPENGFWTFQDDNVELKVGDVINYYVQVSKNRKGYMRDKLRYQVTELVDPNEAPSPVPVPTTLSPSPTTASTSAPPKGDCRQTDTVVKDRTVCSGQTIFMENFDALREDVWKIEQYLPLGPEFPFVSYQRPNKGGKVSVENGVLRIEPTLQETLPGFDNDAITYDKNKLDLNIGCTRQTSCVHINDGSQIMPPIASGRITSHAFAFKYGIVEVRAKLPQGDWLYPDIILESLYNSYGTDKYASGVLRIAGARGNTVLQKGSVDYSDKVLYGGPIMNFKCRANLIRKKQSATAWGDDFHVYALNWSPDRITLLVDGEEYGRIEPTASGLHGLLPKDQCDPPRMLLTNPMAPFDDFFQIALGVSAGGISEFPDQSTTQNLKSKPWQDSSSKARLRFFNDQKSWFPTWNQPALLVDYIKIRAL